MDSYLQFINIWREKSKYKMAATANQSQKYRNDSVNSTIYFPTNIKLKSSAAVDGSELQGILQALTDCIKPLFNVLTLTVRTKPVCLLEKYTYLDQSCTISHFSIVIAVHLCTIITCDIGGQLNHCVIQRLNHYKPDSHICQVAFVDGSRWICVKKC